MRRMKMGLARGVVFIGALLGMSVSAYAAAGDTRTDVIPLADPVTYTLRASEPGGPLKFYIGYEVWVTNVAGNTINNITFEGAIFLSDPTKTALFRDDLTTGAVCATFGTPATDGTRTIRCALGQLKAGVPRKFAVFFEAPSKTAVTDADLVYFRGRTITAEGADAGNSPNDSIDYWPLANNSDPSVTPPLPIPQYSTSCPTSSLYPQYGLCIKVRLGTTNPNQIKSAVPAAGGTFFTGDGVAKPYLDTNGQPTGDSWVTQVTVPNRPSTYTTAEVLETVTLGGTAPNLLTTSETALTIPGTFPKLVIFLRRDASTIVKGAKVSTAEIKYDNPAHPKPGVNYPITLVSCKDTTTFGGPLPQSGVPCINLRTEFTRKTAPTPEWEGDWQFEIWAVDNGRFLN